jgi:hypothetical protein
MNFAGRPLQRSGSAPVAPDPPVRVNFGGPLSGRQFYRINAKNTRQNRIPLI